MSDGGECIGDEGKCISGYEVASYLTYWNRKVCFRDKFYIIFAN